MLSDELAALGYFQGLGAGSLSKLEEFEATSRRRKLTPLERGFCRALTEYASAAEKNRIRTLLGLDAERIAEEGSRPEVQL